MEIINFLDYIFFEVSRKNRKANLEVLSIIQELYNNGDISEDIFKQIRKKILDNLNNNSRDIQETFDKIKQLI